MPKSKKYGVTNLDFGFTTEPLFVTVESVTGPPNSRFILRDKDGNGRIIAFPNRQALRPALHEILIVNHSYKILPLGAKARKKGPEPRENNKQKYKSQVRNSKILFLVDPAKIISLEPQAGSSGASASNGETNGRRMKNTSGATGLQRLVTVMNTQRSGSTYQTVEDVEIMEGNVHRYIGCECCRKRVHQSENGDFICQNESKKKCVKFRSRVTPKIYYLITNIILRADGHGVPFDEGTVCHDANAQIILGREADDFEDDSSAQKLFEEKISAFLFKMELRGNWDKKFCRWKFIINKISDLKSRPQNNSAIPAQEECESDSRSFGVGYENGNTSNGTSAVSDVENAFKVMVVRNPNSINRADLRSKSQNDTAYIINSDPRGLVLIINNTNFPTSSKTRKRSHMDLINLKELFEQLNYTIIVREDATSTELRSIIDDFQDELKNSNCDSCFVVVMTHGSCNKVEMSDGKPVNIYTDIIYKFNTVALPEFEGKSKIFIFQSCQNFDTMEPSKHEQLQYPDTLICLPNLPGFYSHRHIKRGSFYIQKIVEVFMKEAHKLEIQKMLNLVEQSFHEESEEMRRQQPIHIPILFSKDFYFNLS